MQQISKPVILQPDVSQGHSNTDFDMTSETSLRLTWQPTSPTDFPNNIFSKRKYKADYVRRNTLSNANSNTQTNVHSGPVTSVHQMHLWNYHMYTTTLLHTPISIRVASEKNEAWSMFHSLPCIIVAGLVNYVPAVSLET